jgi:uncharacterized protein GlcG (DUF336 family)
MKTRISIATLIVLSCAIFANAQTVEKTALTLDGAKKVIAGAVAYAKKNNAPGGAIAVVDDGGNLVALERLEGTRARQRSSRKRQEHSKTTSRMAARRCLHCLTITLRHCRAAFRLRSTAR